MKSSAKGLYITLSLIFSFILLGPAISKIVHHCEHDHHRIPCEDHTGEHLHDNSNDCDFCKKIISYNYDLINLQTKIKQPYFYFSDYVTDEITSTLKPLFTFFLRGPPVI